MIDMVFVELEMESIYFKDFEGDIDSIFEGMFVKLDVVNVC